MRVAAPPRPMTIGDAERRRSKTLLDGTMSRAHEMPRAHEETLRRLAIGDRALFDEILGTERSLEPGTALDRKVTALVRLGALVALGADCPSYQRQVAAGLAAGATLEEIVNVLVAVAPEAGSARVVSAAPRLALAIGFDVDAAIEGVGTDATASVAVLDSDDCHHAIDPALDRPLPTIR
jgi:4-carboxymuconolactone decarboxylase